MADQPRNTRIESRPPGSVFNVVPSQFPFVSWRSVIAGFFVTVLTYLILMTLGMGIFGLALGADISGDQTLAVRGFGWGTGLWIILAGLISLFAGSYFAGRISNFVTPRIGASQGLVISALFLTLFTWQLGSSVRNAIGWAGARATGAVSAVDGGAVGNILSNPQVQSVLEEAIGDVELRVEPEVMAQGLAVRLLRGDLQAAQNYLVRNSTLTQQQAQQTIANTQQRFREAAQAAINTTADVISGIGWTLFIMLALGTLAAAGGGALGSKENFRHPWARDEEDNLNRGKVASF